MSIAFACSCGHALRVPDSRAGTTGQCPRCGAVVRVPAAAMATNGPGEVFPGPAPLELSDEATPHGTPRAKPPCPKCGTQYPPDVVVCVACGLNLLTGQPIGAGTGAEPFRPKRRVVRDEPDAETLGFAKTTLGVLLHPLRTMELFGAIFSRPEMLAKAAVFYGASFIVVAVAAAFAARPDKNAERVYAASEIERTKKVDAHVPQDWVDVSGGATGLTDWGEPFAFKVLEPLGPVDAGKPFTVRMLVTEPGHSKPAVGTAKFGRTPSHGNPPGNEWHEMKAGSKEGEFSVELPATREGGSSFMFSITCRPDTFAGQQKCSRCNVHLTWTHKPGWGMLVLEDREAALRALGQLDEKPKTTLMAAAVGGAGMMMTLLINLVGLLLSAAIYTAAARATGGGGGFLLMLVTMGYLAGFTNFLEVFSLMTPVTAQVWLHLLIFVYGLGLTLFALMKVYDIDMLQAMLVGVIGVAVKVFGAAWLVLAGAKLLHFA